MTRGIVLSLAAGLLFSLTLPASAQEKKAKKKANTAANLQVFQLPKDIELTAEGDVGITPGHLRDARARWLKARRLREHRSQAPALVMAAHLQQLLAEAATAMFVV